MATTKPPLRWRVLLPAVLVTFSTFVGYAAFYPFIFLWLEQQGFDELTRSMVGGSYFVSKCASPLLWGRLADRTRRHDVVLVAITLCGAASVVALSLRRRDLASQVVLFAAAGFFDNLPMLEAIVVRCLHFEESSELVQLTRAFASVAVGLSTPLFGFVSDGSEQGIALLFSVYATMMAAVVLPAVLLWMPVRAAYAAHAPEAAAPAFPVDEHAAERKPLLPRCEEEAKGGRPRLCTARMTFYQLTFLLVGVQMGVASAYTMVYLAGPLRAPGVLLGIAEAIPIPLQIVVFLVATRVVAWLTLPVAMHTCALAAAVRFAAFSLIEDPWLVAMFEMTWGWTFPVYFTVSVQLAEEFAPHGLQASAISLNHTSRQLGTTLTLFSSFAPLRLLGYARTYAAFAALFAVAATPLACTLCIWRANHRRD